MTSFDFYARHLCQTVWGDSRVKLMLPDQLGLSRLENIVWQNCAPEIKLQKLQKFTLPCAAPDWKILALIEMNKSLNSIFCQIITINSYGQLEHMQAKDDESSIIEINS